MNDTTAIPASLNPRWGLMGALNEHAAAAWPLAMTTIAEATGEPLESVRLFLDSRHGRHFADDVHNALFRGLPLQAAIDAATRQWMGWTIRRQTSLDYGIPLGLPYLIGFVVHCAIADETSAA